MSVGMLKRMWKDFAEFWTTQVFWALLISAGAFLVQWKKGAFGRGKFGENVTDNLIPYGVIVALFVVGNIARTLFVTERDELRRKRRRTRREEHRGERKAELERLEREKPKPNLQFRRVYLSTVFVGHEMSGKSYNAWVLEIGNELSTSEIGPAKEIRAHVTYLDKNSALQTVCPARWGTYQPEESANIKQGESEGLILAFDKGHWYSDLFNGVDLPDKSKIEVRLIDRDGKDLLPEILSFEFRSWGLGESSLTKI